MTIQPLSVGEPAPWFSAIGSNDRNTVAFDEFAGRHIVLFFFGSAARPAVAEVLAEFERHKDLFDYKRALFLGISNDPGDFNEGRVRPQYAGQIYLWDTDGTAAKQYHVSALDTEVSVSTIRPVAFILSPTLQILEIVRLTEPAAFIGHVLSTLRDALKTPPGVLAAPVLVVPDVFDRAFCRQLVDLYNSVGGREIGAMRKKVRSSSNLTPSSESGLTTTSQIRKTSNGPESYLNADYCHWSTARFNFPRRASSDIWSAAMMRKRGDIFGRIATIQFLSSLIGASP